MIAIRLKNELGFYHLANPPSIEQLKSYYRKNYFDSKNFERKYSDYEFYHKSIAFIEANEVLKSSTGNMLNIGCGEGFSLDFFYKLNWQASGIDFTSSGVERHFRQYLDKLMVGDISGEVDRLIKKNKKFDLVVCNNVQEHLLDPEVFLIKIKSLLSNEGVARIQVPNDYSYLQTEAVKQGLAKDEYWFAPHEHISYFTHKSLIKFANFCGFKVLKILGDFPIDFFLFNKDSNYLLDSSKGSECHHSRIKIDNLLARKDPKCLVEFREGLGKAGFGRNVIIYIGL